MKLRSIATTMKLKQYKSDCIDALE